MLEMVEKRVIRYDEKERGQGATLLDATQDVDPLRQTTTEDRSDLDPMQRPFNEIAKPQ